MTEQNAIPNVGLDTVIEVYSGRMVSLTRPTVDMISLEDIAHALARLERYNCHTHVPVYVARHTKLVVDILREWGEPVRVQLAAWLHDMHEAYLGEVTSPVKRLLGPEFKRLELAFDSVIADHFHVQPISPLSEAHAVLRKADLLALLIERKVMKYAGKATESDWGFQPDWYAAVEEHSRLLSANEAPYTKHDFMRDFMDTLSQVRVRVEAQA